MIFWLITNIWTAEMRPLVSFGAKLFLLTWAFVCLTAPLVVHEIDWALRMFSAFYSIVLVFLGIEQCMHYFFGDMSFLQFENMPEEFPAIGGLPSSGRMRAQAWSLRFFMALQPLFITAASFVMLAHTCSEIGFYDLEFWDKKLFACSFLALLTMVLQTAGSKHKLGSLLICCSAIFFLIFAGQVAYSDINSKDEHSASKKWAPAFFVPLDLCIIAVLVVHLNSYVLWDLERNKNNLWSQLSMVRHAQRWTLAVSLENCRAHVYSNISGLRQALAHRYSKIASHRYRIWERIITRLTKAGTRNSVLMPYQAPFPMQREETGESNDIQTVAANFYQGVLQAVILSLKDKVHMLKARDSEISGCEPGGEAIQEDTSGFQSTSISEFKLIARNYKKA